jgi:hypothetical protein
MNKEQMLKIILDYQKELRENYEENRDAFGHADEDTQRAVAKWLVIDELVERLNLNKK